MRFPDFRKVAGPLLLPISLLLCVVVPGCSGPDAPDAPSELSATSENNAVSVSWSGPGTGNVSGYNVYRSEESFDGISDAQKVNGSLVEETSYTDQEAENRTTYHYRVTAVAKSGGLLGIGGGSAESDPSGEVEKTPFSDPPSRP
jgi:hypothetical protein